MNGLGIVLWGLAMKVTLAMLPVMFLQLLASRRGPVAGSWMTAASLAMILGSPRWQLFLSRRFGLNQ